MPKKRQKAIKAVTAQWDETTARKIGGGAIV